MVPSTAQGVVVILLAIVPGYLAIAAWSRAKTWTGLRTDLETIVKSVAVSLVLQVLFAPVMLLWLYPYWHARTLDRHPGDVVWWLLIVVLVLPLISGLLVGEFSDRLFSRLESLAPVAPSSWDLFFDETVPEPAILVVEFTDGHQVAGGWGVGSYALTSPQVHGLLAVEWLLDDDGYPIAPDPSSAGVLIPDTSNIRRIRVLVPAEERNQQGSGES